jgi:hypothetical protein
MTQKTETNFDCYLDIQLQDPEFAASFEQKPAQFSCLLPRLPGSARGNLAEAFCQIGNFREGFAEISLHPQAG